MHNKQDKVYIFPSIAGIFVFDAEFKIIEKIDVNSNDIDKIHALEWTDAEKQLFKKYESKAIKFIAFKKEHFNPEMSANKEEFFKALDYVKSIQYFPDLRNKNILLAKRQVKASFNRDALLMQAANHINELDKEINTLVKRCRDWYELYNPETSKNLEDNEVFVSEIMNKTKRELLEKININYEESMGAEIHKEDLDQILAIATQIKELIKLKQNQTRYIEKLMNDICPNVQVVAGSVIGAKLIVLAGSLKRMSEIPASTVQMLGAEKALFRHIRNKKSLPPKYGVLHEHPFITQAKKKDHGKIARALADKISIAAKVDYFKGQFIGEQLKKDLEKKFGIRS